MIVNALTVQTNGGTLTVMGTTTPSATGVAVNGSNAFLYGDSTFAVWNMPLATSYTAIASATGGSATTAVTVNLARSTGFQYDLNGNLTNDGLRNFASDDENQLVQVFVSTQWMTQFGYDGKMRREKRGSPPLTRDEEYDFLYNCMKDKGMRLPFKHH